jgi:hypothetical protein
MSGAPPLERDLLAFWIADCNRARAESLLSNMPPLTFLIRACSIPSCHAISYVSQPTVNYYF